MIRYLLGGAVAAFMVVLAIGGLTGRVRAKGCCSTGEPWVDRVVPAPSGNVGAMPPIEPGTRAG